MVSKKHHISSYELAEHLNDSLDLIKNELNALRGNSNSDEVEDIKETLVHQLQQLKYDGNVLTNQPIRTIHHLACTGGTLISKCIAALPNVQLLSEVDPLSTLQDSGKPMFGPTDLIRQWRQGSRGACQDDIIDLFLAEMNVILNAATRVGQNVVIRDHSHSHFNSGPVIPERPTIRQILQRAFDVKSVLTVRHPADSYASLVKNGWHTHFQPSNFEEYCRRSLVFIKAYNTSELVKYEDFVNMPNEEIRRIANFYQLCFKEDFLSNFSAIQLTGDSGRKANVIEKHDRREQASQIIHVFSKNRLYSELCSLFDY